MSEEQEANKDIDELVYTWEPVLDVPELLARIAHLEGLVKGMGDSLSQRLAAVEKALELHSRKLRLLLKKKGK